MRRLADSRRVTAGGPSFDRTRAGAEKFRQKQPPHRLHAPARGPQAQGGARRGPHWRSSFRCRSAVCHPTLSTKCEKCGCVEIRTHVWCVKKYLPIYQTKLDLVMICGFYLVYDPASKDRGSGSQGTQSTQSTQSTPNPRAKISPAGKSPCEVARELRDQAPPLLRLVPPGQATVTAQGE